MAKGKIKSLLQKGFGVIEPDDGDGNIIFHESHFKNPYNVNLEVGTTVEYNNVERTPRGLQAKHVKVIKDEYRFLNPYNFVRNIESERPLNHVLGNCPPPPHDRYIGLTGRITCTLKNETLLFVSDSHAVQSEDVKSKDGKSKKEHKCYRFFQYGGKLAIPASSLRGMIRSVFETVTNSCYIQVGQYKMIPAHVVEIDSNRGATLKLIDSSKNPPECYQCDVEKKVVKKYNLSFKNNRLKKNMSVYFIDMNGEIMLRPATESGGEHFQQDLLPDHLSYCEEYDKLCPACRTFGWVSKNENDILEKHVSYAGRLRISHGTIKESQGTRNNITLVILSTPNISTTEFYLLDSSGEPDPQIDYASKDARLRGRKFYHHHEQPEEKEYSLGADGKSDQNRTLRDVLEPGATFEFEIDFENLNRLELGALIYALELENGMFHRLGYAKPLSFGSVKISVNDIEIIDWEERLTSFTAKTGWKTFEEGASKLKEDFKNAMYTNYGEIFITLLSELKALLGKQVLPIHYPRPTEQLDPEHPSYEWFAGNKKRKINEKLPDPVALKLATDKMAGLPLIDKNGKQEN